MRERIASGHYTLAELNLWVMMLGVARLSARLAEHSAALVAA